MKRFFLAMLLIIAIVSGTILSGCIRVDLSEKAGPTATQEYGFIDFTAIEIGDGFELEVIPSTSYSVNITAGENVLGHIKVTKSGDTLKIDLDDWFFAWFSQPKATITMPELTALDLSGACQVTARGFTSSLDFALELSGASLLDMDLETGKFEANLSGASDITGHLVAASSDIELSGASEVRLTGPGGDLFLDASGASHAELTDFMVNNANVGLSGVSRASLTVNGRLDVDLSGASFLEYYGNPTLGNIDLSGASNIEHKTMP